MLLGQSGWRIVAIPPSNDLQQAVEQVAYDLAPMITGSKLRYSMIWLCVPQLVLLLLLLLQGVSGVVTFLYNGTGFVQQSCRRLSLMPQDMPGLLDLWPGAAAAAAAAHSRNPSSAMSSIPVCWEGLSAAVSAGECRVVSIHGTASQQFSSRPTGEQGAKQASQQASLGQETGLQEAFAAELALAAAGCTVRLVTGTAIDLTSLLRQRQQADQKQQAQTASLSDSSHAVQDSRTKGNLRPGSAARGSSDRSSNVKVVLARISTVTAVLGVAADPFAEPPVLTLDSLMASGKGTSR